MLHKKSSSIVKWILIISILEFVFWAAINYCLKDGDLMKRFDSMHVENIMLTLTVVGNVVIVYFFYLFYMNYRKISVTDDAKTLIKSILKVRKTVNYYVWFNIVFGIIGAIVVLTLQLNYDAETIAIRNKFIEHGSSTAYYAIVAAMSIVFIAVFVGLIWLFYRLLYGILLRRLRKNYEELKKIDL
ncbi:hypothetical protein [Flavobacterium sp. 3HN19-14]|uniref:hypothetical protein n=1 Tax=Flavobacterium sp. 3HN19-14 TaxID=3448133 RepID=UPI003EDF5F99